MSPEDFVLMRAHARILFALVAIMWAIHIVNVGHFLSRGFGLRPRNAWGLIGIPCAPLLHWSWSHLMGNTMAFVVLGWFVLLQGVHLFYVVTIAIALFSGICTWLFGRKNSIGAGASGVIYGYMGFLLIYGITSGSLIAMLVAIVTAIFYRPQIIGTERSISGMLPQRGTGWMAHLFGFIGGVLMAYYLSDLRLSHYR